MRGVEREFKRSGRVPVFGSQLPERKRRTFLWATAIAHIIAIIGNTVSAIPEAGFRVFSSVSSRVCTVRLFQHASHRARGVLVSCKGTHQTAAVTGFTDSLMEEGKSQRKVSLAHGAAIGAMCLGLSAPFTPPLTQSFQSALKKAPEKPEGKHARQEHQRRPDRNG